MNTRICAFVIALGCASAARAVTPATLTTLRAIHTLTNAQAHQAIPVAFEATVIFYRSYSKLLFIQDGDVAIFVAPARDANLIPGDRILVRGVTQESFRPIILSSSITLLGHGPLPIPLPTGFQELIRVQHDCMFVKVHGVVRAADMVLSPGGSVRNLTLQLVTSDGHLQISIENHDERELQDLLGAEVEVTGTESGDFDTKMQQTALTIYVSTLADVKILKHAAASPWSLALTPMDQILGAYHVEDLTQRVRVHGTITYYRPGSAVVLQDGAMSLWIATLTRTPLQIGDAADVTGFPDTRNFVMTLTDGEVQDSGLPAPVKPLTASYRQLAFWNINKPSGHNFDLVSIEGQVVTEVREALQDEYVIASDGQLFTAVYHHPPPPISLPSMLQLPLGSRIRVTGICMMLDTDRFNKGKDVPFDILMRSFDDVEVIAGPPLLSVRNLVVLVGFLIAVVTVVVVRGWIIDRKMRRQSAALAYLEGRRSRILEDINGSRSLAEILEHIAELVSFKLRGAPCWWHIADVAEQGNCPSAAGDLRIIHQEIAARSGPSLGKLYAGLDRRTKPDPNESEALLIGAGLATLAIETRRLYSDLTYRSNFDLLTETHNRFSMDHYLDATLEEARLNTRVFGLIFVDLDEFKCVNDRYGHKVGDLYLREAAFRMKRQLRSIDILARHGGDEFAVLVGVVCGRADVEEIALRLERCFDEPFAFEGYILHGTVSVGIAVYPEDADSKDGLLITADAAMYAAKHNRKHSAEPIYTATSPGR